MLTADLETGEDYAYRFFSSDSPIRVRVLATGVAYNRTGVERHNGVRVASVLADGSLGNRFVVPPRKIISPWHEAEHDIRSAERAQARRIQAKNTIDKLAGTVITFRNDGYAVISPDDLMRIAGTLEGLATGEVSEEG